jgi:hypothetical protein
MEVDFRFLPRKVYFPFSECRNRVFYEIATETANGKLATTPHINNRSPRIHISALVSSRKPSELFFGFYASLLISLEPGWVCPLALIRRAPDFLQKSFLDP